METVILEGGLLYIYMTNYVGRCPWLGGIYMPHYTFVEGLSLLGGIVSLDLRSGVYVDKD
jgi:hypothetical protein